MMLYTLTLWLLVAGFGGAGVFNAIGTRATRDGFVRWGYPAWWCRVTGVLEVATALLIAVPATRPAGLGIGAAIVVAAALTVVRRREYSHLMPLLFFALLLAIVAAAHG